MAVNRVWFPNAPSSSVDVEQRGLLAIGYPYHFTSEDFTTYVRRYLQDTLAVSSIGPTITPDAGTETSFTSYLRRYLQDPTS